MLMVDQAYRRLAAPPSSAPSTLRVVVFPVTGEGEALAGVATVGAWFWAVTVTLTLLVTLRPAASLMVTTKVYVPACVKLAVVMRAALVPFAEKSTVAGPETVHV